MNSKSATIKNFTCALGDGTSPRKPCAKCLGKGFFLTTRLAYVDAEVCACVSGCVVCFGSQRKMVDGAARFCHEPPVKRVATHYRLAELPARYLNASFEQYKNFTGNGRTVINQIKLWSAKFRPVGGTGMILSGPVGVGKTFVLVAIAKNLLEQGLSVRFVDFHRLLSVIRAAYSDRKSEEGILRPLIDADVLVIDELGKGRNNDWEQEKLDQVVMGRYNQNKVIIASTNYKLRDLESGGGMFNVQLDAEMSPRQGGQFNPDVFESLEARVGRRIYSRLCETSLMLEMEGEDFRRKFKPSIQLLSKNSQSGQPPAVKKLDGNF